MMAIYVNGRDSSQPKPKKVTKVTTKVIREALENLQKIAESHPELLGKADLETWLEVLSEDEKGAGK